MRKNEFRSSYSEEDLFAPPMARVPRPKVKGPSVPPVEPPVSKRHTRGTIPSQTNPLGVGDLLTDKDILCWLNQELYHMKIDKPRSWTFAVTYIKRVSRWMHFF